jgi:hypothetical protein
MLSVFSIIFVEQYSGSFNHYYDCYFVVYSYGGGYRLGRHFLGRGGGWWPWLVLPRH